MLVWRIAKRPHLALDGEGARLFGGRWNSEGVPVVYASASLALAALENVAHYEIEETPPQLVALAIEVPDDILTDELTPAGLPGDWNAYPEHPHCAMLGDAWARRGLSLVLRVPSAIIPEESNVLLNPRHPEMARVRVVLSRDFTHDPRILKG